MKSPKCLKCGKEMKVLLDPKAKDQPIITLTYKQFEKLLKSDRCTVKKEPSSS